MISAIFKMLSSGLSIINKLLPSWEWKGGQAAAQRDAAEKGLEHARTAAEIRDNLDQLTDAERVEWLRQRDRGG